MKKEIRLQLDLDNPNDKLIYDTAMDKAVATAYIKDIVLDFLKGKLVYEDNIKKAIELLAGANLTEIAVSKEEENKASIKINTDEELEDDLDNEFDDDY